MTRTGIPALAKFMAMPPPMVPQPMTAAASMALAGVSAGTSGTLAAWRSAKNTWRRALDCSEARHSTKICRSRANASAKGRVSNPSTASTQA